MCQQPKSVCGEALIVSHWMFICSVPNDVNGCGRCSQLRLPALRWTRVCPIEQALVALIAVCRLIEGQHELLAAQPAAGAPSGQPACS
eukprot:3465242-Amphidinium_carterae.1